MTEVVVAVIPALNEEEGLAILLPELLAQRSLDQPSLDQPALDHVVVVDNGSTDATATIAKNAGATVVSETRRGYGFACAAGAAGALASGATVIVFMDADGSSAPADLAAVLDPILKGDADLVLGSRTQGGIERGAMPPHQRFGNWLSALLMSLIYRTKFSDLGPFRAIRTDLLVQLEMQEMTFGWPTEMTVKATRAGASVTEVPTGWHRRSGGESKVSGTFRGSVLAAYFILTATIKYARWKPASAT